MLIKLGGGRLVAHTVEERCTAVDEEERPRFGAETDEITTASSLCTMYPAFVCAPTTLVIWMQLLLFVTLRLKHLSSSSVSESSNLLPARGESRTSTSSHFDLGAALPTASSMLSSITSSRSMTSGSTVSTSTSIDSSLASVRDS